MRKLMTIVFLLFAVFPALAGAQTEKVGVTVIGRVGVSNSPYHIFEGWFAKGDWVLLDVGYLSFANPDEYREFFVGGGRTLIAKKGFVMVEEFYLDFAAGPGGHGAKYFQPWTYFGYTRGRIHAEAVYFPYIRLNNAATTQHVIERIKVERIVSPRFRFGAGYGAYRFGDGPWQNKPFVAVTYGTKNGQSYELWLQRLPGSVQLQVRLTNNF